MTEREKMLKEISAISFALVEINLYLDTHPNCKTALQYQQHYAKKRKAAVACFEEKYGPLFAANNKNEECWEWICDPWPWDYVGGAC